MERRPLYWIESQVYSLSVYGFDLWLELRDIDFVTLLCTIQNFICYEIILNLTNVEYSKHDIENVQCAPPMPNNNALLFGIGPKQS